jgi:hypothetical protein
MTQRLDAAITRLERMLVLPEPGGSAQ